MVLLTLVGAVLLGLQGDVAAHKKELQDGAYGNLWDRRDAAKALGNLGTREAAQVLIEFAGKGDTATREAIVLALASIKDDGVRAFVRDSLARGGSEPLRTDLLWALRRMGWEGAKDAIHGLLDDGSVRIRADAARTLGVLKDERCAKAVHDQASDVAEEALLAAARLKIAVDEKVLEKLVHRSDAPRVQAAALHCWAVLSPTTIGPAIDAIVKSGAKPEARIGAADVAASIDPLAALVDDKDWRVRVAAVASLERLWTPEAVGVLVERMQKEDGRLLLDIGLALHRMTLNDLGFEGKGWKGWWDAQKATFKMPARATNGQGKLDVKPGKTTASFFGIPLLSKRIVFIIDFSGSMKNEDEIYKGKRKIDVALEELDKAVGAIPNDARFSVILLSTEATNQKLRCMSPQLVPAAAGRRKGVEFVKQAWEKLEKIKRGRGDIYDAVLEAQNIPEADTVLLLTDGVPTDGRYLDRAHFLEGLAVEHRHRRICVHAILIGSRGIDERLMEGSAKATGGLFMPRK